MTKPCATVTTFGSWPRDREEWTRQALSKARGLLYRCRGAMDPATTGSFRTRIEKYLPPWLRSPPLTAGRIAAAFAVALAVDAVQLVLGPAGWSIADEILDVAAMFATSCLLGFHPLLLPTFVIELFPVADVLPTWTGCVGLVVGLRRREQRRPSTGSRARPPAAARRLE